MKLVLRDSSGRECEVMDLSKHDPLHNVFHKTLLMLRLADSIERLMSGNEILPKGE